MASIIKMSEATYLAIHAMAIIAQEGKRVSVGKLSDITGTSANHLSKVMQLLVKDGYVGSTRGPKGGFTLKMDPDRITLLMIYELFEGNIVRDICPFRHEKCPFRTCLFGGIVKQVTDEFYNYMKHTTLKDIIKNQ